MSFPVKTLPLECVKAFAVLRHKGLSLPFLKENGELLSIALSCGLTLSSESLELYEELYEKIDKLCELYQPFFRYFLALALDLEDLGMSGHKGEVLIDYVFKHDLYAYDTSDTRRLEIIHLLSRRGRQPEFKTDSYEALLKRVTGFLVQSDRFIKLNRPLFYEFTHLIFFGTDFGNISLCNDENIFKSLNHIGMLAYLDNDTDLLAEVCLCYRFLKRPVPKIWMKTCSENLQNIDIVHMAEDCMTAAHADDYHIYFVINWLLGISGKRVFQYSYELGVPLFTQNKPKKSPLSKIFQVLHPIIMEDMPKRPMKAFEFLSVEDNIQLQTALASSPNSENFFHKLTNGHISIA